jgi:DNA-binding NarL/FixJ family response regulator
MAVRSGGPFMLIRLAIVDGHTLIRYGLRELLSHHQDIEIVAECASAAEAVLLVATARPDVVTLGISLPDGDGLQVAQGFRERYPDLGIVILTSQDEDAALFRAVESGASAFVAKTAPVDEVLAAIRHAAAAASSFSASGLAGLLTRRRWAKERLPLSPRETEVLLLLRDGMSIPAISLAMFISQSTAKTYVGRLYDKLGAANRAQALMTAVRHGLIGCGPDVPSRAALVPVQRASRAERKSAAATSLAHAENPTPQPPVRSSDPAVRQRALKAGLHRHGSYGAAEAACWQPRLAVTL